MAELQDISKIPVPSKERGQRSIPIEEAYFARIIPSWSQPSTLLPQQWRYWVRTQPIATTCKETMISNICDLDWKITPRESDQRDELKGNIRHYERLLQKGGESGLDWSGFLEWSLEDLLDLPFGTAWEVGRKGDSPEGRVMWLEPIDGGTCYPTNNKDRPVMQYYNGFQAIFPRHAVARMYMNPRPEIERKGWGIAPPERIFLAMEMLARGDRYYANLLLDVPPVGVFDMKDISWDDANKWVASFRTAVGGAGTVDSFKIPVLAEHTEDVKFIEFGKAPNDIMYDRITLKYASLVCAGYGMNLGDIGVASASSSGETLAGSIRGEQKTNRTGKARVKAKIKYFIESFLPPTLQFDFIDTDGERLSMLGRARLANATAMNQYREMEAISPEEARLQAIQDGLFTISMPEKPPAEAKKPEPAPFGSVGQKPFGKPDSAGDKKAPERPGQVGAPQAPSLGGDGEVKKSFTYLPSDLHKTVEKLTYIFAPSIAEYFSQSTDDTYDVMKSALENSVFSQSDEIGFGQIIETLMKGERVGKFDFGEEVPHPQFLKSRCEKDFPVFLGKAITHALVNSGGENVYESIQESLPEYVEAFVNAEIEKMMAEIEEELPEVVRMNLSSKPAPTNVITVESPQITMPPVSVVVPERSVQVGTPNVSVYPPDMTINFPEQPAPVVNVNVEQPDAPQVNVSVPERETTVRVESPVVNLSVPTQPAPQVSVNVNPTPIEVTNEIEVKPADVNIPRPVREIQNVHRDINLNIDQTVTEIQYKENE